MIGSLVNKKKLRKYSKLKLKETNCFRRNGKAAMIHEVNIVVAERNQISGNWIRWKKPKKKVDDVY